MKDKWGKESDSDEDTKKKPKRNKAGKNDDSEEEKGEVN
jgi:hypothetical protein